MKFVPVLLPQVTLACSDVPAPMTDCTIYEHDCQCNAKL